MQRRRLSTSILGRIFWSFAVFALPLLADTVSFVNGDVSLGAATTFSDSNNGLSATFSSSADPGGFITATSFLSFGPEILYDPGPAGAENISLSVVFNTPLDSISMDFGTDGSGPFDLSAYLGGSLVGSTSAAGTLVNAYPEGAITFSGVNFDGIVLTSPSTPYFAIGNLSVDFASQTPEPSYSFILPVVLGLIMLKMKQRPGEIRN